LIGIFYKGFKGSRVKVPRVNSQPLASPFIIYSLRLIVVISFV